MGVLLEGVQTELALADSPARQIPLGPVDETRLSDDVRKLKRWAQDAARRDCLEWLKSEYLE